MAQAKSRWGNHLAHLNDDRTKTLLEWKPRENERH